MLSWFLQLGGLHRQLHRPRPAPNAAASGACWALIREKYRLIFFGTYPYEQHWRPLFAVVAMLAMLILSADRRMWNWRLLVIWGVGSFVTFLLMFGQIHIPLSLMLFVALVVGLVGMALRKGIADAGEIERLPRARHHRLRGPGAAHRWASCRPGASPSRRCTTSRPACGAASR